jgi:glutaredoxin
VGEKINLSLAFLNKNVIIKSMVDKLIEMVQEYQRNNGVEFEPQIVLFKLHGCKVCKSLESELMVDGWSYEVFDCMDGKHEHIADEIEGILQSNSYPVIFINYPETKVIHTDSPIRHEKLISNLNPEITIYKQLTPHLS